MIIVFAESQLDFFDIHIESSSCLEDFAVFKSLFSLRLSQLWTFQETNLSRADISGALVLKQFKEPIKLITHLNCHQFCIRNWSSGFYKLGCRINYKKVIYSRTLSRFRWRLKAALKVCREKRENLPQNALEAKQPLLACRTQVVETITLANM